ncbi:hypothetical protein JTE90_015101 [Oedothorax gibbosus]|uniref:Orn/DAP/Arg decarboxylase 2 N-terminal domain-containing protein n=1 Tax=Oedothorax gibbosus TaxID=931172 RepID=A0AAV6VSU6_9ARAC|nr:hypothetical protein JTE90_015101 [Oedothorax gibbosus]
MDSVHSKAELYGDFYRELVKKYNGEKFETLLDYLRNVIAGLGADQSFYTIDFADVVLKVQLWRRNMPNIQTFYAVKTNSDPLLLRLLVMLGFSFDCASQGEIELVMQAGASPNNIIFAHVIKTPGALRYSASVGVDLMTFDCEEELVKIQTYFPAARLLLRIAPVNVKCSFDLSDKFGCDAEDAEHILKQAKNLKLDVIGVSFHVGGLCKDPDSYAATIRSAAEVFQVAHKMGFKFRILDIGGGFSGKKGTEDLFDEMTQTIWSVVRENFDEKEIEIIAEPGTFFVGSAATLTTAICGKKKTHKKTGATEDGIERIYYINDSIYGSFFHGVEEYGMRPKPMLEESVLTQRPVYKSRLWGQSCCGEDLLLKVCLLADMEDGEFIMWENMGAYSRVLCSSFCAIPIPATKHIFINNDRLSAEWLNNFEEVTNFLSEQCSLVDAEKHFKS